MSWFFDLLSNTSIRTRKEPELVEFNTDSGVNNLKVAIKAKTVVINQQDSHLERIDGRKVITLSDGRKGVWYLHHSFSYWQDKYPDNNKTALIEYELERDRHSIALGSKRWYTDARVDPDEFLYRFHLIDPIAETIDDRAVIIIRISAGTNLPGIYGENGSAISDEILWNLANRTVQRYYMAVIPRADDKSAQVLRDEKFSQILRILKEISEIHKLVIKHNEAKPFTLEELKFLYEIDQPLELRAINNEPHLAFLRKSTVHSSECALFGLTKNCDNVKLNLVSNFDRPRTKARFTTEDYNESMKACKSSTNKS